VILAIETSCDETCAAVVDRAGGIRANVVASQALEHAPFGGVVPEIAARRHLELIQPTVRRALDGASLDLGGIDAVAVTAGPGLIGALLVGVSAAKGYAYAARRPLIAVDHLDGHIASLRAASDPFTERHLVLLVSGGHTLIADVGVDRAWRPLAATLDDAAGEAFDKGARLLGLGYPGGPRLAEAAEQGTPGAVTFPVPLARAATPAFSFSGLKTALALHLRAQGGYEALGTQGVADVACAYEGAIVDHLVEQTARVVAETGVRCVGLAGGVAANRRLREALRGLDAEIRLAPVELCGDNAAMIGLAALDGLPLAEGELLRLDAYARSPQR